MANYANLLAQIAANIYSNNNQEITGDILQLQLNAMVASLGAGYQFMGVAHPADTPTGYADLRAFWLAAEAGTYTNFGGEVVNAGEVAVLKYDGNGWNKEVAGAEISSILFGTPRDAEDFPDYVEMSEHFFLPGVSTSQVGQIPALVEVSSTTRIVMVDVSASIRITYPVFKSTSGLGSCFIDKDGLFISGYSETIQDTGAYHTLNVPRNAAYFLVGLNSVLLSGTYYITNEKYSELLKDYSINENLLPKLVSGYFNLSGGIGATIDISQRSPSGSTKSLILDCSAGDVFKVSGFGGAASRMWGFLDENNILLSVAEADLHTATPFWLKAPENATKMIYQTVPYQIGYVDCCIQYGKINYLEERVDENEAEKYEKTSDDGIYNDGYLLLATKTNIPNNKQPFNLGYLFSKWNEPTQLYYGHNFDKIEKINSPGANTLGYKFAISPKDGRIIMTTRNDRGPIIVWDPDTEQLTTLSFSGLQKKPMGWLYNSGICFDDDGNGNEICLFAEYNQSPDLSGGFYVWRGVYPYTSEANWQSVLYVPYFWDDQANGITHFHQVRRDPWTGIIYLTSGDLNEASKWWYSTDHGQNFTLLTTGQTSGFEAHICRCINFLFDKDKVYFATDYGTNHCLNSIERDSLTGVLDVSTRVKLTDLPSGQATNFLCYSNFPKGIFMYDRWDTGFGSPTGPIKIQFYSFETSSLIDVAEFEISDTWGGHRGGCYVDYLDTTQEHPAMGFDANSPCIFVLNNPDVSKIGTIYYTILSKMVHTI